MHRLVSDRLRLRYYGQPVGCFERIERVNSAVTGDVPILFFPNFGNQPGLTASTRLGVRFEIGSEKRETALVNDLTDGTISESNRGEAASHPLHQNRSANIAQRLTIPRPDGTDNVRDHATVDWSLVDGRNKCGCCCIGPSFPDVGVEMLSDQ